MTALFFRAKFLFSLIALQATTLPFAKKINGEKKYLFSLNY
jgi:hypothetical protein